MRSRIFGISLLVLSLLFLILTPILAFTGAGNNFLASSRHTDTSSATRIVIHITPTRIPTPKPILTVQGPPPKLAATVAYLVDEDTNNVFVDINGEKPVPMASTTKIMTALVAMQTADLSQPIPVTQSAVDRIFDDGSSAGLKVGDSLSLKDMLYGLLIQSGDDAAYAIAEQLGGGSRNTFVQHMNLFAQRHHLFQTHYDDPDGLNGANDFNHYSTARDLVQLAEYAMHIPLFAQIVKTQHYAVSTTRNTYTWTNTNDLLATYKGMTGIKTGHTYAAGYCLVFSATRGEHHLIGAVLNSPSTEQRDRDVTALLNWGFALPMLPPNP